jgi:hypothetical protein
VVTATSLQRSMACTVAPGASTTVRGTLVWSRLAGLPSSRPKRSITETPGNPCIEQACLVRLVNCSG